MRLILHTIFTVTLLLLILAGLIYAGIRVYEHNQKFFNKTIVEVKCNYIEGTKQGFKPMRKIECEW